MLHILNREGHRTAPLPEIAEDATAVEEFLPEMGQAIPLADRHAPCLLLLEPSLPQSWLRLRWETLDLCGRPLSSQVLVVRRAAWRCAGTSSADSARFLDLFPPSEFSFADRLQPLFQRGSLRTCRTSFLKEQMTAARDLVIVAHGRAHGLIDASGLTFDLPVSHPMPERIWLLACNVNGAMDDVADHLLKQGCRSVISATSDLSAPEMARLVEELFATGDLDESVSWLARVKHAFSATPGCRPLTIWGECDIDPTPCAEWNRLTWENDHGKWCRLPLDDESTREEFLSAYQQAMSPYAWPLTRRSMLPPLLWLAEKHHHPAMTRLSAEIGEPESPAAIRGLAASARRVGNYVQMAKYLSLGLGAPDLTVKERAEYLGALTNLFIDLNLPESASLVIDLHEDCLWDDPRDRCIADFKRLDWLARMEARRGRLHVALDLMTTKRKLATIDTGRELAWQLYLSAWGQIAGQVSADVAAGFADAVAEWLAGVAPQDVGYGNETIAYLLRALAAHAWANNDPARLNIAKSWLPLAEERLTDDDPGPWAYTIAYLYLQGAVSPESLDRALSALERARYFLEAASLSGFAGRGSNRCKLLARFQQRRQRIVAEMRNAPGTDIAETLAESAARSSTETDADDRPASASHLGTMPL